MARTKQTNRKASGGIPPRGCLVKKRPRTDHRTYSKISDAGDGGRADELRYMNFSLQVAKRVLQVTPADKPYENVACSPLSISAVLSVLAVGSDGPTREQLVRFMECDSVEEMNDVASRLAEVVDGDDDDEDAPVISFATAVWVADCLKVKEDFQNVLRDFYKTEVRTADFQNKVDEVVKEANLWAEEQSKGLIKQIISRECISQETMIILANALYFKGVWVNTFKPENTRDDDFYLLDGSKTRAPFMTLEHHHFEYGTLQGCKILRMLYREGEKGEEMMGENPSFSMYIFLPDDKEGLPHLIEGIDFNAKLFNGQIKLKDVKINKLHIPKYDFECDLSLTKTMKELGLTLPFDKVTCQLTQMVECPGNDVGNVPFVDGIYQKCRIQTNEKGTKAAALIRVQLATQACRRPTQPPPVDFVADHPFMFMIREDFSGTILFVGTVLDPLYR